MKKLLTAAALMVAAMTITTPAAHADLRQLLGGAAAALGMTDSTAVQQPTQGSSMLDNLMGLGTALGIIPEQTVDINYLTGKWKFSRPAVAFQSDNFLQRAGGLAAAQKIEDELLPYYKMIGLNRTELSVKADGSFVMTIRGVKLKGQIEPTPDKKTLTFNFVALGRIPAGSMEAYINAENNNSMAITFDVTKLVDIMKKVASLSGNSTISTVTSLLNSYDGITAGFSMTRSR